MSTGSDNRKAVNVVINPGYQLRFTLLLVGSGFILFLALIAVFYFYIGENYQLLVELSPMTEEAKKQLSSELNSIMAILSALSIVYFMLLAILGMFLSHRTAGPLYHLKKAFDEVASGNKALRVYFRPKDDFRDVAESFNKMMDSF